MHSGEHVRTTSRNGVSRAVEGLCVSFTACCWVPAVVAVVCVLDEALLVVFEVVAVGFIVVVGDDVAAAVGMWGVVVGSLCITGARGSSGEGLGGADGCRGRRLSWWCWQDSSVEHTTRSDERVCSSSHNSVVWAADRCRGLSTAWVAFSEMVPVVWVPAMAQVVVPEVVAAGVVGGGSCDVVTAMGRSGRGGRGWGLGWGAVG
jgi:hypothetical protein